MFATRFDTYFSLVVSLVAIVTSPSFWYVDSGDYHHIIGIRYHFTNLNETGIYFEVVVGDDSRFRAVGVGTISF